MIFDSTPGKFKILSPSVIDALSAANKSNYFMSFHSNALETTQMANKPTEGLKIQPSLASARERQEVIYPEGFLKKFHPCWKRTDQLQGCLNTGWTYVTKADNCQSFRYDEQRNCHVVGITGQEETVLLKEPIEQYWQSLRQDEGMSKQQQEAIEASAEDKLRRLGGKPFTKEFADARFEKE